MQHQSENNKKYKKLNSQMAFVMKSKQQSSLAKEAKQSSNQMSSNEQMNVKKPRASRLLIESRPCVTLL